MRDWVGCCAILGSLALWLGAQNEPRPTAPINEAVQTESRSAADSPLAPLDNFHAIDPGRAYRSARLSVDKLEYVVREHGLCTVINLIGGNETHEWYREQQRACTRLGVELIDVRMSASEWPRRHTLLSLYDALSSAQEPVLIHCRGGADRSGAASSIWRMVRQGAPNQTARQELSTRFGHFRAIHPQMDELVECFVPDRAWIEHAYPVD